MLQEIDLTRIDLNLLVLFEALMREAEARRAEHGAVAPSLAAFFGGGR